MAEICRECGNNFSTDPRPDGQPNGLGFELEDGSIYYVCIDCFIKWRDSKVSQETEDAING